MAQWKTFDLKVPEAIGKPIEQVGRVASAVATLSDEATQLTRLASTLVTSVVEPTRVAADLLQKELDALGQDVRRAGGYVSGDWLDVVYPFDTLQGGYPAFESRMVGRLLNQDDPTRPAFTLSTSVAAVFFYSQVADPSELGRLLQTIQGLASLFRQSLTQGGWGPIRSLQVLPEPPDAPTGIRIRWEADPQALPPGGFAVCVSTTSQPFSVELTSPDPNGKTPQTPQLLLDPVGVPLQIQDVKTQLPPTEYAVPDGGKVDPQKEQLVLRSQGTLLSMGPFQQASRPIGQATFYLGSARTVATAPTGHFSLVVKNSDLPLGWDRVKTEGVDRVEVRGPASTLYVRVAGCPAGVADRQDVWRYDVTGGVGRAKSKLPPTCGLPAGVAPAGFGSWSDPVTYQIASSSKQNLQDTLQAALIVFLLTRSDLPIGPQSALIPTGLESLSPILTPLLGRDLLEWSARPGQDSRAYRALVWDRTYLAARSLTERADLSTGVRDRLVAQAAHLLGVRVVELLRSQGEDRAASLLEMEGFGSAGLLDLFRPQEGETEKVYREWIEKGASGPPPPLPVPLSLHPSCGGVASIYASGLVGREAGFALSLPGVVRLRAPHFASGQVDPSNQTVLDYIEPDAAPAAIESAIPGVAALYRRYRRADGSVKVPAEEVTAYRNLLTKPSTLPSPVGEVPLLMVRSDLMFSYLLTNPTEPYEPKRSGGSGFFCFRTLLCADPLLLSQTQRILQTLSPVAPLPTSQGAWRYVRATEITPGLDLAIQTASGWLGSVSRSAGGAQDAARQFGTFSAQAATRSRALTDQLTQMVSNFFGSALPLPNVSILAVTGRGVEGVVGSLLSATNKPPSTPTAYGAGCCLVLGGVPGLFFDLLGIGSGSGETRPVPDLPVVI